MPSRCRIPCGGTRDTQGLHKGTTGEQCRSNTVAIPRPTGEPCQLELPGRSIVGIDPYPWEGPGGWRWRGGERFGLGEPTWVPRVTAKADGRASALRTMVTQNLICAP